MHQGIRCRSALLSLALLPLLVAMPAAAETVVVPAGTPVYAELDAPLTTHRHRVVTGDVVLAHVTDDVVVDGEVVVAAGTEVKLRVVEARKARFLGRKGRLVVEPSSVQAVDGSAIPLTGSYDRSGKGRKAVTAALSLAVAWPFLFLRGKNATVPAGTVFAAEIADDASVQPAVGPSR